MNRTMLVFLVLMLNTLILPGITIAAWSTDPQVNTPIATGTGREWNQQMVSDGSGGAIVVWENMDDGSIYAQRIDADGKLLWAEGGVAVSTTRDSKAPRVISDGNGGAIVAWMNYEDAIYLQRLDKDGALVWAHEGVVASPVEQQLMLPPVLIGDGAGGSIVAWVDGRSGGYYGLYAQKLDATGSILWKEGGVSVTTATQSYGFGQTITDDGAGGAVIAWEQAINNSSSAIDIYAQRLDDKGALLWGLTGKPVCSAAGAQRYPQVIRQGSDLFLTWYDWRTPANIYDIYAQKLDLSGAARWTPDGVAVCTAPGQQINQKMTSDGDGGLIVVWDDMRASPSAVYLQRVDAGGTMLWQANGIRLTEYGSSGAQIMGDGAGGSMLVWQDLRNSWSDIYTQKVNSAGVFQWASGGVAVSTADKGQSNPLLVSDGRGGAIITWYDTRNFETSATDIYAQRLFANGTLNPALPTVATSAVSAITSVAAVSGGDVTATGDSAVSARGVCWGTSPNPSLVGSCTADGSGTGAFASALSSLSPGTLYHVRAYATNSAGTVYGGDLTFTTVSLFMPGDVNNDKVVNVFDALLTLQFSVGLYKPTDEPTFKIVADVAPLDNGKPKGNNTVDVFDALAILRHAVGLDPW